MDIVWPFSYSLNAVFNNYFLSRTTHTSVANGNNIFYKGQYG